MRTEDRLIASCKSWKELWERTKRCSIKKEKGRVFERLTQLYLQTSPEYRTKLQNIWLLREVPPNMRQRLNLPAPDEGIDLIAQTRRHEYWAIQSKFRSQTDQGLTRRELGTFASLAFNTCNNIALAVVSHTSSKPMGKRHLMRNTVEIGLDRWLALDQKDQSGGTAWNLIRRKLQGRSIRPKPRRPRPHQSAAISAAKAHFIRAGGRRGRLIMPCGTGKSLTAYWIAEALKARTIIVAVPSLALIRQSLADWTREFLARGKRPDWLCVCSDESVGKHERDEIVGEVYDLGLPTHTDPKEIAAFLRLRVKGPKIVFTTYQSSPQLARAAREARIRFDFAILDEAHKTVGKVSKPFATLLSTKKITIHRRIFMTATERVFRGNSQDVLSMDDSPKNYGARFYELSFKEAIKQKIISDYRIITTTINNNRIRRLIDDNRILNLDSRTLSEAEAQSVAAGIALKHVYQKHAIAHAISFHRSIRAADQFRVQQDALNRLRNIGPRTINFHISSKKTAGQRSDLLDQFVGHKRALMTNARCLTEGVDVPAIDCVMFADPKQSQIDIIQATGRALRRYEGKDYGYILIPIVVPDNMKFEEFAETTAFRQVVGTITALSTQDERIAEEFRAIERGRISKGTIVEIEGDVPVGMKIKLGEFAQAISTRIWESLGRANWRSFEEARAFVHKLRLTSNVEWRGYCTSGKKPPDIPSNPNLTYAKNGWVGYGDWLGTGTISPWLRHYRSFHKARAFVRALHLTSGAQWRQYCESGKKPPDIPANPHVVYAKTGWASMGDWLGTGTVAPGLRQYRPFYKARAFVRKHRLTSANEWRDYCRSGKIPADIPANPHVTYAKSGWAGWGDWLGTGTISHWLRRYRSFQKARAFVHKLGLRSGAQWSEYCKSGKKPADIPAYPNEKYAKHGWAGMGNWLGTGRIANRFHQYRSFQKARAFVRKLRLKSQAQWNEYRTSGKKVADIPGHPHVVYAKKGWIGFGDWLGTGIVATRFRHYRSFQKARAFARALHLTSGAQWRQYCKSGKKPDDIPANPIRTYEKDGWAGMGDWLGTGTVAPRLRQYRSFQKARAFVHTLGLRSGAQWKEYCKRGEKPADIPSNANLVYARDGWAGMGDWLGTGRVANRLRQHRSFQKARAFVRKLSLTSQAQWSEYCKSGKKPADIPADPRAVYEEKGWAGMRDWLG